MFAHFLDISGVTSFGNRNTSGNYTPEHVQGRSPQRRFASPFDPHQRELCVDLGTSDRHRLHKKLVVIVEHQCFVTSLLSTLAWTGVLILLQCVSLTPEIDVTRASDSVKSRTGSALTSAREPKELKRGVHVAQPTRTMGMLKGGAVYGVEGAVAQLQPLTVEQERHHVEKVQGEQANVSGRKARQWQQRRSRNKKYPAETKKQAQWKQFSVMSSTK